MFLFITRLFFHAFSLDMQNAQIEHIVLLFHLKHTHDFHRRICGLSVVRFSGLKHTRPSPHTQLERLDLLTLHLKQIISVRYNNTVLYLRSFITEGHNVHFNLFKLIFTRF